MRLIAPATAAGAGVIHALVRHVDNTDGRWNCVAKEYTTYSDAATAAVSAALYVATDVDADFCYGGMIGGLTGLGQRAGWRLGRPKSEGAGPGCAKAIGGVGGAVAQPRSRPAAVRSTPRVGILG